jgi:uncharacterized phosphosugar-binding protein
MPKPILLILGLVVSTLGCQQEPLSYTARLRSGVDNSRRQLEIITSSAQRAADRITHGGRLWVGGSQVEFSSEAVGRAGGLMAIAPAGDVAAGDVVLVGSSAAPTVDDRNQIQRWKHRGAYVFSFADTRSIADVTIMSARADSGRCDTRAVQNLANLWTWTGEFAAACTRLEKTPVFYQSYGIPGGRLRDARYLNLTFHRDVSVRPIRAGELGRQYLDALDHTLQLIQRDQQQNLRRAGQWLAAAAPDGAALQYVGHIWPAHLANVGCTNPFGETIADNTPIPARIRLVLHMSYQQPPQPLIDRARNGEIRLVYCSVRRGHDDNSPNIIYINPHWPIADGCVDLPGYDVPILPASGVVQSCIYSEIVEQASIARRAVKTRP